MPDPQKQSESPFFSVPHLSRPLMLASFAAIWTVLVAYDLLTKGWTQPPAEQETIRTIIPLLAIVPALLRIRSLEPLESEQDAYKRLREMVLAAAAIAVSLLVLSLGPMDHSADGVPMSIWSFFCGRLYALAYLSAVPYLLEPLVCIFRFRMQGPATRLPGIYLFALFGVAAVAQLAPLDSDGTSLALATPLVVLASLVGTFGLVLASRNGWIINLRKGQKWGVAGFSLLGLVCISATVVPVETGDLSLALLGFAPGLSVLGFALHLTLIFTFTVTFVSVILALPTAGAIDRRNTEVSSLANFARLLTQSLDTDHMIDTAVAIVCDATGSAAAWIELRNGEAIEIRLGDKARISKKMARQLMTQPIGKELVIAQAVAQRRRVEVIDRLKGTMLYHGDSPLELRSLAAAPLRLGENLLGTIYAAKDQANGFDRRDVLLLGALADQIALAIEQSRLIRRSLERERFEQEMLIARDLQERLLPKQMPSSPYYELYAESLPASIVGGDYYDVVAFSDNTIGLLVADVSGKGASAALYMGMIKGIVQALSGQCSSPKELMARANVALHGSIDQRWFATMTCAQIVDDRRTLHISRAGHCPTLLIRDGVGSYSKPSGLGLAIARPHLFDRNLELEEIRFGPGDYAIFFSDGLPEARSPEGEEFGYDALMAAAVAAAGTSPNPKAMRDAIFTQIAAFTRGEPLADDSTLAIMRWC